MKTLPEAFVSRMKALLGEEYKDYEASFSEPAVKSFRVNTNKISLEEFEKINCLGGEKIPYVETGYYLNYEKVGNHPYHHAGMIYVQDPGAMAPAECLDIQPNWRVLDLCAAPGGKSSQLRNKLGEEGILFSNEIIPSRCKILTGNVERLGFRNTVTTCMDPTRLAALFPRTFDLVMVDAPCSGEGMFRKEEAAITDWSQETVEMCAHRQAEILHNGAQMVRPGGRLVYSTCTFAPEEDELAVAAFLESHPDFEPEVIDTPWFVPAPNGGHRLWPHKLLGEGHFAAVLKKTAGEEGNVPAVSGEKLPKEWLSFARELGIHLPPGKAVSFGTSLFWVPEQTPDLKKLKVLRPGLELGEVKKGRFEPAHALALWLHDCANTIRYDPDSPEMKAYLHGEVLPCSLQGWCLVKAGDFSIGWGKADKIQLKNHYPKGLRR